MSRCGVTSGGETRQEREAREQREYVAEVLAGAPPLDAEQVALVRSVFGPAVREWARRKGQR